MGAISQLWNAILGNPNPRKRPRNRDLFVIVKKESDDPCDLSFKLEGDTTFANNGRPGFNVFIDIVDEDQTGCQFHAADPIWVVTYNGNPNPPPCPSTSANWDQFRPVGVFNKGRTLLVRNRNDSVQNFSFTLRFDVPGCAQVVPFDPIGSNQNGLQE